MRSPKSLGGWQWFFTQTAVGPPVPRAGALLREGYFASATQERGIAGSRCWNVVRAGAFCEEVRVRWCHSRPVR